MRQLLIESQRKKPLVAPKKERKLRYNEVFVTKKNEKTQNVKPHKMPLAK